jgi:hypothetical protein
VVAEDAAPAQDLGLGCQQRGVGVVGDVQAWPFGEVDRVRADQGGQGGGVDDDLGAVVRLAGASRGQRRHERGPGCCSGAVADQADPAQRQ